MMIGADYTRTKPQPWVFDARFTISSDGVTVDLLGRTITLRPALLNSVSKMLKKVVPCVK